MTTFMLAGRSNATLMLNALVEMVDECRQHRILWVLRGSPSLGGEFLMKEVTKVFCT